MAEAVNPREVTSTLHLGLRSVSGSFPSEAIDQLIAQLSEEEQNVLREIESLKL